MSTKPSESLVPYPVQDLAGRLAIVTGATRGIGRAITLNLVLRGCSVLGTYNTNKSAAESLSATISTSLPFVKFFAVSADIFNPTSPAAVVKAVLEKFPGQKVDILVNNASASPLCPLKDLTQDLLSSTFQGSVIFPTLLVKELLPHLSKTGSARIVNISSEASKLGRPNATVYSASKAALESCTRTWAKELGQEYNGLTCNAVVPGMTETDLWRALPESRKEFWKPKIAETAVEGRLGRCEEVAGVVGWLVGEGGKWVSGECVVVNGGANMFV